MADAGSLYIVATPIGNLEDITIRAIKTLFSVNGIACEDTRKTGMLLKLLQEKYSALIEDPSVERPRLIPYHEHNEHRVIPELLNALKNGLNIALVSDAGTPGISDPGFRLIRECVLEGVKVISVPGPSSVISALVSSGLPTDKFLFLGYPPHKGGKRGQLYEAVLKSDEYVKSTIILFKCLNEFMWCFEENDRRFYILI